MPLDITLPGITLRPVTGNDLPFLRRLYASTRAAEMARTGWSEPQQAAFLAMQFDAQQRAYLGYPDAEFLLIVCQGEPVGRMYLQSGAQTLHVIDLSLLPSHRHRGIGSGLLAAVLALAQREGKTVELHVERGNRAQALYRRLGFQVAQDKGVYLLLSWTGKPDHTPTPTPASPSPARSATPAD